MSRTYSASALLSALLLQACASGGDGTEQVQATEQAIGKVVASECAVDGPNACLGIGPAGTGLADLPIEASVNVLNSALEVCSTAPLTGWYRDGYCRTDERDRGVHVVCATVTDAFLQYSKARGNDLTRPSASGGFPGLVDGDGWCLCAARWDEARRAGVAPPVRLKATHHSASRYVDVDHLASHSQGRRTGR